MKAIWIRSEQFVEACGSLIIAAFTGLYVATGLMLAGHLLSRYDSGLLRITGLALLAFGLANVPILFYWSRQLLSELVPSSRRADVRSPELRS